MEVRFADKSLARKLGTHKDQVKNYGADVAKVLNRRLNQLAAAENLETMRHLPGRCHELRGDRAGRLAVSLTGNLRLVFEPADDPVPRKADGGLEWSGITEVTILEVEDYHGK